MSRSHDGRGENAGALVDAASLLLLGASGPTLLARLGTAF